MKAAFWSLVSAFILFAGISQAQQIAAEGANSPPSMAKLVLRNGTAVNLKLAQNVNSRTAREDEPVEFALAEPVKVGDVLVADVGSRAIGAVIHSARPNFEGDPGEISVKLTFLKAGKTKVPLRGSTFEIGSTRVMLRGTQALVKEGTPVKAYVDADTEIELPVPTGPASPSGEAIEPQTSVDEAAQNASQVRLPNGTPVWLLLTEPLSSKTAKVGDSIKLQVLEDVRAGDLVVIPARSPAIARISEAKSAGMAWHKGQMAIRVESVTLINQETVPLELATKLAGEPTNALNDWAGVISETQGLALFALPFAPLQHGNQAKLRRGAVLEAVTGAEAVLDRGTVEALQPEPFHGTGPAAVTFYFPTFERARFHEIWIGSVKLGNLKEGRKILCQLPPGRYSLRLRKKARSEVVDLEPGGEYYVRLGFLQALVAPGVEATGLTMVAHDIGEMESMDLRPAGFQADTMKMSAASLQEEPVVSK